MFASEYPEWAVTNWAVSKTIPVWKGKAQSKPAWFRTNWAISQTIPA